jgi:hypothetical protein
MEVQVNDGIEDACTWDSEKAYASVLASTQLAVARRLKKKIHV